MGGRGSVDSRAMFGFLRRHHREGVKKQPFPDAWLKVLSKNVPMYAKLSAEDQTELRGHIQVLIDEKTFEEMFSDNGTDSPAAPAGNAPADKKPQG